MEEQRQLQLTNRRTTLMASLERAEQFVSKYQADRDQAQVPLRIENIDNVWMGLEDVQTQLEELEVTEEGREQNNQIRSKFESVYFKVKAALNSLLPASPIQTPSAIPNPPANLLSGIKLPTISLPEFDGDYNQWLAFHDTFVALIHSNADVPDVQKFHYLRAALKGEAAQLIESIAISSANYTVAWQTLTTRYANDYLLKKRHLQALLDCPRMKRESAEALHSLVDEYQRHTKILHQLQEPVDQWSTMLEHMLCIRLDDGTLKAWEDHATTVANPNYTCLVDFLQRRIRVLESMSVNHQSHNSQTPVNQVPLHRKPLFHKVATHIVAEEQPKCYACNQYHFLIKCPRFEKMNVSDRMRLVDNNRLCQNCFRHDHFARNCQSKYSCRHCQRRHHTLLHHTNSFNESTLQASSSRFANQPIHAPNPSSNRNNAPSTTYTCASSTSHANDPAPTSNSNVLLSTVVLLIIDSNGNAHPARALLDSGSQSNIMNERLCQMLKLKRRVVNIPVHGVGESASNVKHSVHSSIRSRRNDFQIDLDFLVLPRVTIDLPAETFPASNWQIPSDLFLADPSFNKTGAIDLLLGAEHFYNFVNTGTQIEQDQKPLLVESVFGWIVVGRNQFPSAPQPTVCHVSVSDPLHDAVEHFWKSKGVSNTPNYSVVEQQCESHFVENVTRTPEDRNMICLPRHSERRFQRDPNMKQEFQNSHSDYESLGHPSIVPSNEPEPPQTYIPHPPVGKESHTTTKVGPEVQGEMLTLIPTNPHVLPTLADASEQAHRACTYTRSTDSNGGIDDQPIAAKSSVAPLKLLSIPRFELSAAVLATRLRAEILEALTMSIDSSYFWSESSFTLEWLRSPPHVWKIFIANRLSEIQTTNQGSEWNHVAGIHNPADLIARGMKVKEFLSSDLWHYGSSWLCRRREQWPSSPKTDNLPDDILERRVTVAAVQTRSNVNEISLRRSPYWRLQRVTAFCLRFTNACRRRRSSDQPEGSTALTVEELSKSRLKLEKLSQWNSLAEEFNDLGRRKPVSKRSNLRLLSPFLDSDGIIRVGERLNLLEQPYHTKHPILLPSSHPFTRSVAHYHLKLLHGGGRVTFATMRQEYWPIQDRRLLNTVLRQCFQCTRASPTPATTRSFQEQVQRFWYLWRTEYFHELQKKGSKTTSSTAYQPGRMVILVDESLPPTRWPLARTTESHPGRDEITRTVTVKTSEGIHPTTYHQTLLIAVRRF
ncbi:uncharacterized protein LOC134291069 [Aedes albopictus]|uniref:DUF5641 domain-containing protein n=1 Tax=Aedes albopictus TaxID=7160 RepID=A0ABM1YRT5_AEDAL